MNVTNIYRGSTELANVSKIYKGRTELYSRVSLDAATQALLTQATTDGYTAASGTALDALDAFIVYLKAQGIWTLLDALWLPATNGDSDFACYNLKDPTSNNLTKVNSPTITSLEGFTGNGTTSYINTNFTPSTDGVNYVLNSAHVSFYMRTNPEETAAQFGVRAFGSGETRGFINRTSGTEFYRINDLAGVQDYKAADLGLKMVNRSASNINSFYEDGTQVDLDNATSSGVPSGDIFFLAQNSGGSAANHTSYQLSMASVGGDLSSKSSELYTAIQTYMTAIGKQV